MKSQIPKNNYSKVRVAQNVYDFGVDISYGLSRKNKFIPSKYFYDKNGSYLFDKICDLPEYYLTKKETQILSEIKEDLLEHIDGHHVVAELGSGAAIKTRHLFETLSLMHKRIEYYPIDISDVVRESSRRLQNEFGNLHITGIVDQYESGLNYIKDMPGKKIIVFFGSSIGNFTQEEALEFLKKINDAMNEGDLFLLGADLVKSKKILESAYNDSKGVTGRFNLNLLCRINDELGGNFDVSSFEHVAVYNSKEKRIEMYLESRAEQQVNICNIGLTVNFKKGERICTEYSHKYTIPQIRKAAKMTGFEVGRIWTDKQDYFALALLSKESEKK
jgi:L-histidine N-alpha-methyltransferase